MKFLTGLVLFCIFIPILFLVVFTPEKCEHEGKVTMYSFTSYNSTAQSSVRPYCRDCGERFQHQLFEGTPVDQSYLEAIKVHSDSDEIIPGEYYTITATVPQGYNYGSYDSPRPWLNCQVENEDFIVGFNVDFKEEFREVIKSIEKGEEITFRGRFYDEGCGFTDAELILDEVE